MNLEPEILASKILIVLRQEYSFLDHLPFNAIDKIQMAIRHKIEKELVEMVPEPKG